MKLLLAESDEVAIGAAAGMGDCTAVIVRASCALRLPHFTHERARSSWNEAGLMRS